ncbi:hypothetical protein BJ138DRAFT_973005, partial [Hygrophoropsis aurantiaca]
PFGGVNVIFAGDFAQLPPAGKGNEAGSLYSGRVGLARRTVRDQEAAIGKAMWHQITTVVILRQNMRQTLQSDDDAKLRTALENMRYKNCTEDDIAFLMSRVAGVTPDQPSLRDGRFRNVSIITAWNSQKDRINELGAQRFASDNGRDIVEFFSEDKWATTIDKQMGKQPSKKSELAAHKSEIISLSDQEMLWSLSPHTSDHIAASLDLCVGMPVMIRNNDATELCITKGQEGKVVGWQSSIGSKGQQVLDTLFVLLVNPPTTVQIEGLPLNVVPICKSVHTVPVRLQDDSVRYVQREQVNVLVNFAMTDYAAQGKTRP